MLHRSTILLAFLSCIFFNANVFALVSQPFFKDSFLNLKDDLNEANKAGHVLVLFFEQDGCPYCAEIHKVHFADKKIVELIKKRFDVVQLDIWGGREVTDFAGKTVSEKQLARNLKIQFSPMVSFIGPDGKEIFRMAGYYKPHLFKAALDYVADGDYKKISFREYAAKHAPEEAKAGLIDEPFFSKSRDLKAAAAAAAKHGKGIALLFEQAQCADCVEMHKKSFGDPAVVKKLSQNFDVVRINMWDQKALVDLTGNKTTETKLAAALQVRYSPTIIFFDKNGKEILRHESYLKPEHFATLLTYLTTDARIKYKSFQDWLRFK